MSTESMAARKITQAAMRRAKSGPTVADLRAQAKTKKIKGYSKMTKAQLMKALSSAPSTSGAAVAGPSKTATPKKAASPKAKENRNAASSSKPLYDFIQNTWKNLRDKYGYFSENVVMELDKPMLDFLAQKLIRFMKHFASKTKDYNSFRKTLEHFDTHGLGVTDPELKEEIKQIAMEGFETIVKNAFQMEENVDPFNPEELKETLIEHYYIQSEFITYVGSLFPRLNKSKWKNFIVFQLIALMQSAIVTLKEVKVKTKSENGRSKITLTKESIRNGFFRNTDIALFFS